MEELTKPPLPSPPPLHDISKKHKMPMIMLPPPNRKRQPQPIQSVAPLKSIGAGAEDTETLDGEAFSLDLSIPPPTSFPSHNSQPDLATFDNPIEILLHENEVRLLNYIRLNNLSISEVCDLVETYLVSDSNNNNQLEAKKNPNIPQSIIKNVLAISEKNKTFLQAFQQSFENANKTKETEKKEIQGEPTEDAKDRVIRLIHEETAGLKEELLKDIRDLVNNHVDERLQQYFNMHNRKSELKSSEGPAEKKSKVSQPHHRQLNTVVSAEIAQEPQRLPETWGTTTQRMYHKQQQQQQAQHSVSAPGVTAPAEEARPHIGSNNQQQIFMKNHTTRQHQQNAQEPAQEYQQSEWNWGTSSHQASWPLDPRVRMRSMRSTQQQPAPASSMPNTIWGHTYCNAHGQGQY